MRPTTWLLRQCNSRRRSTEEKRLQREVDRLRGDLADKENNLNRSEAEARVLRHEIDLLSQLHERNRSLLAADTADNARRIAFDTHKIESK